MRDLISEIVYIRAHRFLIPFFVLVMFLIALVAFLTTLQTVFTFGNAPWCLSSIEVAFALGMMFMFGISIPYYIAPTNVMIQEKVEANYLSHFFSVMGMISSSTMPLSMIIFGLLVDVWSVDGTMIAAGVVMLVLAARILTHPLLMEEGLKH